MIKFENVSVKYIKDFYALFNINFCIKGNTLFLGGDYDGAFAIFRLLAKIDKNYTGNIILDDVNLKSIKQKNLDIAYICRENFLFKNKTALQNVLYPFKVRKQVNEALKNKIISKLKKCGINENEKIKNLPFSKQKLVCVLRAMFRQPTYLIIENPFENLDETNHQILIKLISAYTGTIIASGQKIEPCYQKFEIIQLDNGSIKKE